MTWPVVDLAFWSPGDPGSEELDRLVLDDDAPLARHGLTQAVVLYARERGLPLPLAQRHWSDEVAARALAVDATVSDVVRQMDDAGLPFFIAKGPAVLHRYAEPRVRGYSDLDVYVPQRALPFARRKLMAFGFTPVAQRTGPLSGQPRELHGGRFGAVVEIHADAVDNFHRRWLPPIERFLPHVQRRMIADAYTPVLADSAHLCLLATHLGAGHRYARLSCLRDVSVFAPEFDAGLAAELGADRHLSTCFGLLAALGHDAGSPLRLDRSQQRLIAALSSTDAAHWDEYAPTLTNLRALVDLRSPAARLVALGTASRALGSRSGGRVTAWGRR